MELYIIKMIKLVFEFIQPEKVETNRKAYNAYLRGCGPTERDWSS